MQRTNVLRILDSKLIGYKVFEYEVSEDTLDAITVANKINADIEQVFKTLIARSDNSNIFVFVIPGRYELDLKKAAKASGSKKIELIKVKELLPLTGYIRGGCSPVGMKKSYPTFIDESADLFDDIYVSAGKRGMQIKLSPEKLCEITEAAFADLI
jgi:Cys-tRNA(Pro)/Cys-tRNA(Cys) deacylase